MRALLALALVAPLAARAGDRATSLTLQAGDLGVVKVVKPKKGKEAGKLVLEVWLSRAWRVDDVKPGTKLATKEDLVIADAQGVLLKVRLPVFNARGSCENDGGQWTEPFTRVVVDPGALPRPLGAPLHGEQVVALAALGSGARKALTTEPTKRTLMRVDFDGDGVADAELHTAPHDAGCGPALSDPDLLLEAASLTLRATCCGP